VMYYALMLRCWQVIRILVRTNYHCLRVRRHRWYQSHYSYNTSCMVIFLKTTVWIHLDARITGIYFLYLLFVMTHRRQGKKVSILPSGDVNPRPVPSRRGLLEDNAYRVVGAVVHRAMSHDRASRACGNVGMYCGHLRDTWICSCTVCSIVHAALNVWVPPEGLVVMDGYVCCPLLQER
jgi:hypothetical protein